MHSVLKAKFKAGRRDGSELTVKSSSAEFWRPLALANCSFKCTSQEYGVILALLKIEKVLNLKYDIKFYTNLTQIA